jgi:hypothetical protein
VEAGVLMIWLPLISEPRNALAHESHIHRTRTTSGHFGFRLSELGWSDEDDS